MNLTETIKDLEIVENYKVKENPLNLIKGEFLSIKTKEGSIAKLKLNFAQKKFIELISTLRKLNKPIRIVILKARQLGISTLCDALIYAYTSQREGINSLVIADDIDGSNYLLEIIKLYQEKLDRHLKVSEKKSNEKKLEFDSLHSQILVDTANNDNAGRKYTYQYVHLSEVAFFPENKVVSLMSGLMQSIPLKTNTMVFAESTANGVGGYFYDLWNDAESGKSDWTPFFLAWYDNPDYSIEAIDFVLDKEEEKYKDDVFIKTGYSLTNGQMLWRRLVIKNNLRGDDVLFKQEYPAYPEQAFLVTGRNRFNIDKLVEIRGKCIKPIYNEGNWSVYKEPLPRNHYIIGVDVAEGLEKGDNSVAQVLDAITFEQVAKYRGKIEPDAFGRELALWGKKYNEALIAVEVNNHGLTTLTILKEIYSNIFYRKIYDKVSNEWTQKIGWQTSAKSKPFLIDHLATAIKDGIGIVSIDTINELMTFVINEDGTCSAQEGKYDDEVISLAIANQVYLEGTWKQETMERNIKPGSVAWELEQMEKEAKDWRSKYKG